MKVQVILTESVVSSERCFHAGETWECSSQADADALVAAGLATLASQAAPAVEHPKKAAASKKS